MNRRRLWQVVSWHCARVSNGIRSAHFLVAGLLALWLSLIVAIDCPLRTETRRLALQLAAMPEPGRGRPAAAGAEPRDVAKEFAATLPAFDAYADQLRALHTLADQNSVLVARVDYRYEPLKDLPIRRLVMRMGVTGQDLQQRSFLLAMLDAFPNLSIARLAYAKSTDGLPQLEQSLEIHLYYRWKAAT